MKKGLSSALVGIILVLVVIFITLMSFPKFVAMFEATEEQAECHLGLWVTALIKEGSLGLYQSVPDCSAKRWTLDEKFFQRDYAAVVKAPKLMDKYARDRNYLALRQKYNQHPNGPGAGKVELAVAYEVVNDIRRCWDMVHRGKLPLLQKSVFSWGRTQSVCVLCAHITPTAGARSVIGGDSIDLKPYMEHEVAPGIDVPMTYYEFISEGMTPQVFQQDWSFDLTKPQAVVFSVRDSVQFKRDVAAYSRVGVAGVPLGIIGTTLLGRLDPSRYANVIQLNLVDAEKISSPFGQGGLQCTGTLLGYKADERRGS